MIKQDFFVSFIIATLGRYDELERNLASLARQNAGPGEMEVILVDQNESLDLTPLAQKFKDFFPFVHIKSKTKGLSHNRNLHDTSNHRPRR